MIYDRRPVEIYHKHNRRKEDNIIIKTFIVCFVIYILTRILFSEFGVGL